MSTPVRPSTASPAPPHEASDATQCHHTLVRPFIYHRPLTTAEKRRLAEMADKLTDAFLSRLSASDALLAGRGRS